VFLPYGTINFGTVAQNLWAGAISSRNQHLAKCLRHL